MSEKAGSMQKLPVIIKFKGGGYRVCKTYITRKKWKSAEDFLQCFVEASIRETGSHWYWDLYRSSWKIFKDGKEVVDKKQPICWADSLVIEIVTEIPKP